MTTEYDKASRPVTDEEILAHLRGVALSDLELPAEQVAAIGPDTSLVEGLHLDSLAQVILLSQVEDRYGFVFGLDDREQLQTLQTVGEFVGVIRERAKAACS
jgi:acyl carrier protein